MHFFLGVKFHLLTFFLVLISFYTWVLCVWFACFNHQRDLKGEHVLAVYRKWDKCTYVFVCLKKKKAIPWLLRFGAACKYNKITIIPIKDFYFVDQWIGHRRVDDCSIPVVCASSTFLQGLLYCAFSSQGISVDALSHTGTPNTYLSHQSDAICTKNYFFGPISRP